MKKNIFLVLIALLFGFGFKAQNLLVTLTSGTIESFPVEQVRSIKFGTCSMIVNEIDGTTNSWNLDAVESYAFDQETSGVDAKIENTSLYVFPNPSLDVVQISYSNTNASEISISLIDASGKEILQIYKGQHQGKKTYATNVSDLLAGTYFVQIMTETRIIRKPIVIQ
jgi:hypothetical protein